MTTSLLTFLILALILLRFIPSATLALVLSAFIHAPFYPAVLRLFPPELSEGFGMDALSLPVYVVFQALYWILLLGGIAVALRWIKRPGVALVMGAIIGSLIHRVVVWWGLASLFWTNPQSRPTAPSLSLVGQYAALGLLLWLGLCLTRKPKTSADPARLSRSRFLLVLTATAGLGIYLSPSVISNLEVLQSGPYAIVAVVLAVVALLLCIVGAVVWWVFVYRMWASLPEDGRRMKPGQAVGFSFIPIFNIYWIFPVFRGFAWDFNALVTRHALEVKPLPVALFTALPIYILASVVAASWLVAYLPLWWAWYFLLLAVIAKSCDGINTLLDVFPGSASPEGT